MIYSFKSDEVEFMAREEVPWTLDGEFGGAHEEVIVKNICRAVDIMVPAKQMRKIVINLTLFFERSNI